MLSEILQYWPWLVKIGGLSTLIALIWKWATAYPLLVIERRKSKALTELVKVTGDQNKELEEYVNQQRRLQEIRESRDGSKDSPHPHDSNPTPTSLPPEPLLPNDPNSNKN